MQIAQTKNSGISFKLILNSFLSVNNIAIKMGIIAIENLKNRSVVGSIPFCVNVLTNIPLDPNINPARIGKIKYSFFIISLQNKNKCSMKRYNTRTNSSEEYSGHSTVPFHCSHC